MERSPEQLKKRERLIQLAGVLLMLSPLANFFLSVYFLDTVNNKWTPEGLSIIIRNGSPSHWVLWFSSFCVGAFMIKGRRASWMPVLAVLGVFVVFNFWNLKKDMQRSTVRPIVLLLTNMSIFALVYSQEFYQSSQPRLPKREPKPEEPPAEKPLLESKTETIKVEVPIVKEEPKVASESKWSLKSFTELAQTVKTNLTPSFPETQPVVQAEPQQAPRTKTRYTDYEVHVSDLLNKVVEFEGFGPWARITEANLTELHMEALGKTPPDIQNRRVEIVLRDKKVLKLRMARQSGPKFIFVYREMAQAKAKTNSASKTA